MANEHVKRSSASLTIPEIIVMKKTHKPMKTKVAEKVDGKEPLFIAGGSVISSSTVQISNKVPK